MRRLTLTLLMLAVVAVSRGPGEEPKPAELAKGMAEAAREVYDGQLRRRSVDPAAAPLETLYVWSRRWMEATQAADASREGRIAATQAHLDRMKKLEAITQQQRKGGFGTAYEESQARFYRLEAELWLVQAKAK